MEKLTLAALNKMIDALKVGERLVMDGIPEDMYHDSLGLGSTILKQATISMAHYKAARDHIREFTAAQLKTFAIGSAAHCLVLEPELYEAKFIVQPVEMKTRAGKKWTDFKELHRDKDIITAKDEAAVNDMANAILDSCGHLFIGGEPEKSYWYRHDTGLILKARIDYQRDDFIIDLKTTKDVTQKKFNNTVKYDYDIQDASYRLASGLADMIYAGVGKTAPHSTFLTKHCDYGRELAEAKLEATLKKIAYAEEFGEYPNLPVELCETEYSDWEREHAA